MRILLTGGAGFIGSNLADALLKEGHFVLCLDDLSTGSEGNINGSRRNGNFVFVKGDIRDRLLVRELLTEHSIDAISHQAARGSVPKSIADPLLTNSINVEGTLNVLWAAKEAGVKRVVCAISSSVYGDTPVLPKVETMPYNPMSPYAISKVADDMYCKAFHSLYGLETVGLRYFNVYGPRQDPNGDYAAVVPRFAMAALSGKPLTICGDGKQSRDFTYVDDVVRANMLALSSPKAPGHSMNIAFGKSISVNELAKRALALADSKSKISYVPPRAGDVRDSLADLRLAKEKLGYEPKVGIDDGLKRTVEWFRANPK